MKANTIKTIPVNPNIMKTREWDLPIKLYYAQMRAIREEGIWGNVVTDIGSSIETDETELVPLHKIIREAHKESLLQGDYTNYASSYGTLDLREAITGFYTQLGCQGIDMHSEVMVTGGTINAVHRIIRALDMKAIIIPSWAPFFARGHAMMEGLEIIEAPFDLTSGDFDLGQLDKNLSEKGHQPKEVLMYIAHPASPVGTVMTDSFIEKKLIPYLTKKGKFVISDTTVYSTQFDGSPIRPMMSYAGFRDIGVESITISKEFGLPGCRIGGLVGNKKIINAVRMLAGTEVDILPAAEQRIAAKALRMIDPRPVERRIAKELQTEILPRLKNMGWPIHPPKAGVDMILEVPPGYTDPAIPDPSLLASFSWLRRYGVGLCPGSVFSSDGKNYLRLGLKQLAGKVPDALDQMVKQGFDWGTDSPSDDDIQYLKNKIKSLDLTRL